MTMSEDEVFNRYIKRFAIPFWGTLLAGVVLSRWIGFDPMIVIVLSPVLLMVLFVWATA